MSDDGQGTAVERVAVLIDWNNCRSLARRAFGHELCGAEIPWTFPAVSPAKIARVLAQRVAGRRLTLTYVFAGEPDRERHPRHWSHFDRLARHWRADGVRLVAGSVRTGSAQGNGVQRTQEKGVDIALALEAMFLAQSGGVEGIILFSADADFLPLVRELHPRRPGLPWLEVACWRKEGLYGRMPGVEGMLWHTLNRHDYEAVEDPASVMVEENRPPAWVEDGSRWDLRYAPSYVGEPSEVSWSAITAAELAADRLQAAVRHGGRTPAKGVPVEPAPPDMASTGGPGVSRPAPRIAYASAR
jgi:hypothetical protein